MVAFPTAPVRHSRAHRRPHQPRTPAPHSEKKGLHFRVVKRKLTGTDPQRPAILARIRWIWRHLPRKGLLVFFDVQPIAVKAYGGRRYTSQKRLVLERYQKTRGRFHLFAAYNVGTGRVHWAFKEGKSTRYVCDFFRRLRRYFPAADIWVALDQDRSHPVKCRLTRRTFRDLRIHWVSLPKGCPDDNPVENLFSGIQLMVLDNSNDSSPTQTKRRITNYFRARNKRSDRRIHITYLGDSHK